MGKAALLAAMLCLLFSAGAPAQLPPPPEAARDAMARLAHLAGRWRGEGWMDTPAGRKEFDSEETAELRLDGRALVVEGLHRDKRSGAVVHHALGLLSWDVPQGQYRFSTTLLRGVTGHHAGRIEDGRFVWGIAAGQGALMRYAIPLGEPDAWVEYGELSRDGGATWTRFFEMRLTRR